MPPIAPIITAGTSTADDAGLLAAWRSQRDEAAFRLLCDRYAGLVAAACRRLGSPDTDEAAQAVFILLARRPQAVGDPRRLAGWLLGVSRRMVANQRRATARRRQHEQEAAVEHARQLDEPVADTAWTEALPLLDEALGALSPGRREALVRFYLQGRTQGEVAAELGCSTDAVKTRVHEGLTVLRSYFARRGVALGAAALISGLAAEASASSPALGPLCAQAALAPATAPIASALATKGSNAMIIKIATLATGAAMTVASVIAATVLLAAEPAAPALPPPPAADAYPAPSQGSVKQSYDLGTYGLLGSITDAPAPEIGHDATRMWQQVLAPPEAIADADDMLLALIKAKVGGDVWEDAHIDLHQSDSSVLWVTGSAAIQRRVAATLDELGQMRISGAREWRATFCLMAPDARPETGVVSTTAAHAMIDKLSGTTVLSGAGRLGQLVHAARLVEADADGKAALAAFGHACQVRILAGQQLSRVDLAVQWVDPLRAKGADAKSVMDAWSWRPAGSYWLADDQALVLAAPHPAGLAVLVFECRRSGVPGPLTAPAGKPLQPVLEALAASEGVELTVDPLLAARLHAPLHQGIIAAPWDRFCARCRQLGVALSLGNGHLHAEATEVETADHPVKRIYDLRALLMRPVRMTVPHGVRVAADSTVPATPVTPDAAATPAVTAAAETRPPVNRAPAPAVTQSLFSDQDLQPALEINDISALAQTCIAPGSWQGNDVSMVECDGCLVISQTPAIHEQIADLFDNLERRAARQVVLRLFRLPATTPSAFPVVYARAWQGLAKTAQLVGSWPAALGEDSLFASGCARAAADGHPAENLIELMRDGVAIAVHPERASAGLRLPLHAAINSSTASGTLPITDGVIVANQPARGLRPLSLIDDNRLVPDGAATLLPTDDAVYALTWELIDTSRPLGWVMPVAPPAPVAEPAAQAPEQQAPTPATGAKGL